MRLSRSTSLQAPSSKPSASDGFTLLETLIAIGMIAVLLGIYASVLSTIVFLRRVQNQFQAANFIQEELDGLRQLPFTELVTRTNGNFLGFPIVRGPWQVTARSGAPSGSNVLELNTAKTAVIEETGMAVIPGDYRDNFTYSAKVRVKTTSPGGWGAGIVFRYRDAENHYRFRITSSGAALDKVVQGTKTTIWSNATANSTNTWYTLEVETSYQSITVRKNGSTLTTQTDYAFDSGDTGLLTLNGALVEFDDVTVSTPSATTWNFDSDTVGSMPTAWQRLSYADLPSGTGTLTISNYLSQTTIKEAVVTIGWNDGNAHTVVGKTLIHK